MINLTSKLLILLLSAGLFMITACNDDSSNASDKTQFSDTMSTNNTPSFSQEKYGQVDGQDVIQYTLTNPAGMVVKIINYGGTITQILVPDSSGKWDDVVLGFDSLSGYLQSNNPYFGCLVGRYANRIANGKFTLNGKVHQLPINNNGNSLHGGIKGLSKVVWTASPLEDDNTLKLTYLSKDGDEGYPGNLSVQVVYTLTTSNELKIEYTATTDKGTPINLTNHSYFNLSAGKDSTVYNHEVTIHADKYVAVNDKLIPTGELVPVKGTPMDFNSPVKVGKDIAKIAGGGFDHTWVLNKKTPKGLELAATVYHPGSGRYMEVFTTEPGVQFYTGNFLDGTITGSKGINYVKHGALCLETQHFPDSPNQPSFPNVILRPGETYKQTTVYKFSTR